MFLRSFTTGKTRMAALTLTLALGAGLLEGPLAGEAFAGLTPKGQTTKAGATNPESDAADIILPMPGGVSMAFRAVAVDANGFLWDKTVRPGTSDAAEDRGFYDGRYTTGISAPFRRCSGGLEKGHAPGQQILLPHREVRSDPASVARRHGRKRGHADSETR